MATGSLFKRKPFYGNTPQPAEQHAVTTNTEFGTAGEEGYNHAHYEHGQEEESMNENYEQFNPQQEEEHMNDEQMYQTEQTQAASANSEVAAPFMKKTFSSFTKPEEAVVSSQPGAQAPPAQPAQTQPSVQPSVQPSAQPSETVQVQPESQFQPSVQPTVAQPSVQVQAPVAQAAIPSLSIQPQPVEATKRGRKAPGTCPDGLIGLSVRIDPALYARLKMTAYRYNTKNAKVVEALIRDYCPEI